MHRSAEANNKNMDGQYKQCVTSTGGPLIIYKTENYTRANCEASKKEQAQVPAKGGYRLPRDANVDVEVVSNLKNKRKYAVYIKALYKVRRAIQFTQSPWLTLTSS